jgi:4-amino-4-deoxy-L-arabinose transferase-like glycosyltransferase
MYHIHPRWVSAWHLLALAALCGALYFPHLGRVPFFNKGEPREALVVQEIVLHRTWLFPLKMGNEIPSKPPLFHWFGALTSVVWGRVNEATVRFPSALFATAGVLLLYALGRRLFDPRIALVGGVILATSVAYQGQAVSARVDMTLAFFMTLTLVTFYLLYQGLVTGGLWTYAFYILLGISTLAKGPVGLVLPGMVIWCFLALRKRWDFLSQICFHKGALVALVIGISWYGVALVRGGEDFFDRQVMHENLTRFFVYGEEGSGHQKPFYYYLPYLMLGGLPWSLFLPFAIVDWLKNRTFTRDHYLFLALWAGAIFLFFSLSAGKRPAYLLPLYPPLSLLIAAWLGEAPGGDRVRAIGFKSIAWLFVFMGLLALGAFIGVVTGSPLSELLSNVGMMLKGRDQSHLSLVRDVLGQAGVVVPAFLLCSALLWLSTARHLIAMRCRAATAQLACLSVLTALVVQGVFIPAIAESRSYKPFVMEVNRRLARSGTLSIHGEGWDYASVVFYRGDRAVVLKDDDRSLQKRLRESGDYYIMAEAVWRKMVAAGAFAFPPELTSQGTGPDGKDPIVLVRGFKVAKENP